MPARSEASDWWALTARFPLGVYRGHLPDGSPEVLPSFRRTFDALTSAAALGSEGVEGPDGIRTFSDRSRECLTWLAANPPDAVAIPPTVAPRRDVATAWRKEGVFRKEGKAVNYKVTGRWMHSGTAIDGVVAWCWSDMPGDVREQLDRVAADVPYLGESESVVVLSLRDDIVPTHRLEPDATPLRPSGVPVELPAPDRLGALERAHRLGHPVKRPSKERDRHNTSAMPASRVPPTHGAVSVGYYVGEAEPVTSPIPWPTAVLIPVAGPSPADNDLVSLAALMHRALVQRISAATPTGEVPSSITGIVADGSPRPANHLAIHWLAGSIPSLAEGIEGDHLALLVPRDSYDEALEAIAVGIEGLRSLRSRRMRYELRGDAAQLIAGDRLWRPPADGMRRWWRPSPVAVPERAIRVPGGDESAHAAIAMLWSLGNVFRDEPGLGDSDPVSRRRNLEARGARVAAAAPVPTRYPLDYVHRTNRRSVVRPYTAMVDLGDLAPVTSAIAVGQARHVGGGLLLPVDLPHGDSDGRRKDAA